MMLYLEGVPKHDWPKQIVRTWLGGILAAEALGHPPKNEDGYFQVRLRCGWSIERALTEPVKHCGPRYFRKGKTK